MKTIRYDISTVSDREDLSKHEAVRTAGYKILDHSKQCREDSGYLDLCQKIMTAEVVSRAMREIR